MWYVRHAPTDSAGVCVGRYPAPVILTPALAADQIMQQCNWVPNQIFSSDLPRCMDLARTLAFRWDRPLTLCKQLREISMGVWEGLSFDTIQSQYPKAWQSWCDHWQSHPPPGGESLAELTTRAKTWVTSFEADMFAVQNQDLLVGHAGFIRALMHLLGTDWNQAMATPIKHLRLTQLSQAAC